jgi:hypothetical protein
MLPYFAGLIVLIAAILFTVFQQNDSFATATATATAPAGPPSLYDAICREKGADMTKAKEETKVEKESEEAVEPSTPEFSKELENRITKSIATQLKDKMILDRATQNVLQEPSCPYASYTSDATTQGAEYAQAKPHPGPDMSEYIRKDSIPCWNCSLP